MKNNTISKRIWCILAVLVYSFYGLSSAIISVKADSSNDAELELEIDGYDDNGSSYNNSYNSNGETKLLEEILQFIENFSPKPLANRFPKIPQGYLLYKSNLYSTKISAEEEINKRYQEKIEKYSKNAKDNIKNGTSVNNWGLAVKYDDLYCNTFHNYVQKDVRKKYNNVFEPKELYMEYNSKGNTDSKEKKSGRADLWKINGNTISIWEVKPPSFEEKNLEQGIRQLKKYTEKKNIKSIAIENKSIDDLLLINGGEDQDPRIRGDKKKDENKSIEGEYFFTAFVFHPDDTITEMVAQKKISGTIEMVMYDVDYSEYSDGSDPITLGRNGLIIYNFKRTVMKQIDIDIKLKNDDSSDEDEDNKDESDEKKDEDVKDEQEDLSSQNDINDYKQGDGANNGTPSYNPSADVPIIPGSKNDQPQYNPGSNGSGSTNNTGNNATGRTDTGNNSPGNTANNGNGNQYNNSGNNTGNNSNNTTGSKDLGNTNNPNNDSGTNNRTSGNNSPHHTIGSDNNDGGRVSAPTVKDAGAFVFSTMMNRYVPRAALLTFAYMYTGASVNGTASKKSPNSVDAYVSSCCLMFLTGKMSGEDFADNMYLFYGEDIFKFGDGDDVAGEDIKNNDSKTGTASTTTYDPLILDLSSDGYGINTKKSGAYFDLNCDSFAERINWTTTDGILAVDKNVNGSIDDGNEVFGDSFVMGNGNKAANGFEALASFDENGDGFIDSKDWIYSRLLIWVDANGNGKSEKDELTAISDNNITRICLTYETINELTDSEAVIGNESYYEYKDGSTNKIGEMWVSSDLYDALETICAAPTEEIAGLPNVRSFGKVHSLHYAMTYDETGRLKTLVQAFDSETDHDKRIELTKEILSILCDTDAVDSSSRGSNIDAKHLAVIEAVLGKGFVGTNGANPNPNAAVILEEVYNNIVNTYYHAMISSRVYTYISKISETGTANGTVNYDLTTFNSYVVKQLSKNAIDNATFVDVCDYLNYFSKVMLGNNSLLIEFMDYVGDNAEEYLPLVYNSLYDSIKGTPEADELHGTDSDDLIFADDGDDSILAGNGNDCVLGHDGDDIIYGGNGNDMLFGGAGNDTLYGGYGNDTYMFSRGCGQDTINEQNKNSSADKVCFGSGISFDDIILSRDDNDMIFSIKGTNDSLRIVNQYSDSYYRVESFEFKDDTAMTASDMFSTALTIYGDGEIKDFDSGYGTRNTTLIGSDKNDTIFGYSGDDILDGGKGNDVLYGGYGNDVYKFGIGCGQDIVNEDNKNSSSDKILFGKGVSANDLFLSRSENDMILTIKGKEDVLRIINQYGDSYYRVEMFEFADGTIMTSDDWFDTSLVITGSGIINDYDVGYGVRNTTLIGSGSDDTINGYSGNDILDGKEGNDTLYGGYGNDTYKFGIGYGHDIIDEQNTNSNGDRVVFGEGIDARDIALSRDGNDMILSIKDTDDDLRIVKQYCDSYYRVELFEFSDNTVLSADDWFSTALVINGSVEIKDYDSGFGTRDAVLNGSETDDVIHGYSGNDVLDGGAGNDILYGGYGNDNYKFGRGYGNDVINEDNKNSLDDRVIFADDIDPKDIILSRIGNDMILTIKETNDSLRIVNQYCDSYYRVELFEFNGDNTITADYWYNKSLIISGKKVIKDFDSGYGTRNSIMIGSEFDDTICSYSGDDVLDGGSGNDILYGGYGNDTYKFGRGYGNDTINEENTNSSGDKVVFGDNITLKDIQISRCGNHLVFKIKGTEDTLKIVNQYCDSYYRIENFEFADGSKVNADYWYNTSLVITGSNLIEDYDKGYGTRNTTLIGSETDDVIYAYSGNDVLDGGKGNDTLYGGYGNDTYMFGLDYGQDIINEQNTNSGLDKVLFGKDITFDMVIPSRDANDMILSIRGTNDSLRIVNQYCDSYYRIEEFEFADGSYVTSDDLYNTSLTIKGSGKIYDFDNGYGTRNAKLIGSDEDDVIFAYSGNDILDGGAGNDTLYGGYGNDTYKFGRGYGNDIINEDNKNSSADKLLFVSDVTLEDLILVHSGNDLVLSIKDTEDSIRIINQYSDSYYRIEIFEFSDGTIAKLNFINCSLELAA